MPCLWAAWTELASLNTDYETLAAVVPLPQHWMQSFFRAHAALEAQKNSEAVEAYAELLRLFPRSGYVKSQLALAQYNLREFDAAQQGSRVEAAALTGPQLATATGSRGCT